MSNRLSGDQRRQQILNVAEAQFATTGLGSTTTLALAKAAGISEPLLYMHFATKRTLFEEVAQRNVLERLAGLRQRLLSIPAKPTLNFIECIAEATILACVGEGGSAAVMAWALLEMPEFAADLYRTEMGATEALWANEIKRRFPNSVVRSRLEVHLIPYAVNACMSFGLWLATLRHKPMTAQEHARLYATGIVRSALGMLAFPSESHTAAAAGCNGAADGSDS